MSIDDGVIDEDHKFLIEILNECEAAFDAGLGQEHIVRTLKKLECYTVYHFVREEALQREIGWPDWEKHAEKHRQIAANVKLALSLVEQGLGEDKQDVAKKDLLNMLRTWIVDHIIKCDLPMAPAFKRYRKGKTFHF